MVRATLMLLAASGCAVSIADGDDAADPDAAAFSPIGRHVIAELDAHHHAMRGHTWNLSLDNALEPGWVVQTPVAAYWGQPVASLPVTSACDGDPACDADFGLVACSTQEDCRFGGTCTPVHAAGGRSLCTGHSDAIYDQIYDLITSAHAVVDITSLGPPDGRFEAAVRNALATVSRSGAAVRVRYLYGAVIASSLVGDPRTTGDILASLVRDVAPASPIRVAVGAYRDSLESWNHAKLIAIDGKTAIVGGANLWTQHYLDAAPVHDLSMRITGGAAAQASQFANELWRHTCVPGGSITGVAEISNYPATARVCDEVFALPANPAAGGVKAITVGRLGTLGDAASDDAIVALVDSAQTQLRLSLQDIGPVGKGATWPEPYLRALVAAAGRGVDIQLVLSNIGALPGGLMAGSASYSNGWTPADVMAHLADYAAAHPELLPDVHTLCQRVHAAVLRPSADDAWPSGAKFANHAKLAIVDDAAFYLGSQNWYPSDLIELGYIVDDAEAARALVAAYYAPMWSTSSRTVSCTSP